MKTYKGSCYCEEVKFEVRTDKDLWVGHCHCNQCQKIHAASYVTWVGFFCEGYEIKDTNKNYKVFKGKKANRGFCSNCGSNFFFCYHDVKAKFYHEKAVCFARSCFETEIEILPSEHIHFSEKKDWYDVSDDLLKQDLGSGCEREDFIG